MKLNILQNKLYKVSIFFVLVSLLLLVYSMYLQSCLEALITPTLHLDGAFQTASALFRLSNDEVVGRDFYFYLGLGPLYLLYPIFKLTGGTLADSVFVSFFITKIVFVVSIAVLTKLAISLNLKNTLLCTLVAYVVLDFVLGGNFTEPGNSLKPIRSFAPIIGAVFLYLIQYIPMKFRPFYMGVVAGLVATWSNDFGYFSAAFLSMYFIYEYVVTLKSFKKLIVRGLIFSALSLITYFLVVSILTNGNFINWTIFNFKGVGENQWRYYESFTKKIFVFSDLYKMLDRDAIKAVLSVIFSAILTPTLFVLALKKGEYQALILSYVGLVLSAGAFLSEYAGHIEDSYWIGVLPWSFFAVLYVLNYFLEGLENKILSFSSLISVLLAIYFASSLVSWNKKLDVEEREIVKTHIYNQTFNSYYPSTHEEFIKYIYDNLNDENISIVEEYTSLASVLLKKNPVVAFDSVIHALGVYNRDLYLSQLNENKPNYAFTTSPLFSHWQAWGMNQNWWFYNYLFENYRVKKTFHNQYIWQRNKTKLSVADRANLTCSIKDNNILVTSDIKMTKPKLVSVSLDYEVNKGKNIILLKNNLHDAHPYWLTNNKKPDDRFVLHEYVSIDTTKPENNVIFPAYITKYSLTIESKVLPKSKTSNFKPLKCSAKILNSPDTSYFIAQGKKH